MTVDDVAVMMAVHPNTIRARAHSGVIPGARIGSLWRFWRPSILALAVGAEAAAHMMTEDGYDPADDPEVVTPGQLAELLGVNLATVLAALKSGAIPAGRVVRRWQVSWPYVRDAIVAGTDLTANGEQVGDRQ